MKKTIVAAAMLAATIPALAQINVNINLGQPDFYGRIDTSLFARPPVYISEPVIIERTVHYRGDPVYLRVPPGHRKKWSKHCHRYNACGQPVLFVQDSWYSNTYAPRVLEASHRDSGRRDGHDYRDNDHGKDHGKAHGKGHGNGHGNGKGNGKGHGKD